MSKWEEKQSEVLYRLQSVDDRLSTIDKRLNNIEKNLGIVQTKVYFGAAVISFIITMGVRYFG